MRKTKVKLVKKPRKNKSELVESSRANILVDDSYTEFYRAKCRECEKDFPPSVTISGKSTEGFCSPECALKSYYRRLKDRERAIGCDKHDTCDGGPCRQGVEVDAVANTV